MKYYIFLITCLVLNVSGQLLLKSGAALEASPWLLRLLSWRAFVGLCLFGLSAVVYVQALKLGPLTVAQSILMIQYACVMLGAWLVFGETLTPFQILGCLLIALGLVIVVNGR